MPHSKSEGSFASIEEDLRNGHSMVQAGSMASRGNKGTLTICCRRPKIQPDGLCLVGKVIFTINMSVTLKVVSNLLSMDTRVFCYS